MVIKNSIVAEQVRSIISKKLNDNFFRKDITKDITKKEENPHKKNDKKKKKEKPPKKESNKEITYKKLMGVNNVSDKYMVIYKMNFISGKHYIGFSYDYYNNRFKLHNRLLNGANTNCYSGKKINQALQTDTLISIDIISKLYIDDNEPYMLHILEYMFKNENHYITKYDSINNGYNSVYNDVYDCAYDYYSRNFPLLPEPENQNEKKKQKE